MRCDHCGRDFNAGLPQCPYCQSPIHYGGNTQFYNQAAQGKLSIIDLFVSAFQTPPPGAADRMFASGTALTTPTPDRMLQEWNKPWLYARVILFGAIFLIMCYFLFKSQGHILGMFMFLFFGCMIIPLAVLTFYWEINIPRDIPLYKIIVIFFIGGTLSLIFALLLPDVSKNYFAPLTEEPAKVVALAIFVYFLDCKHIAGGMLIGAAVGAGFSAFEDISYVLVKGLAAANNVSELYEIGSQILIARTLGTLGGHVTWAAIEGGALVWAKGNETLNANHFFNPRFLGYLGITMAIHFINNTGISIYPLPYVMDLIFPILSFASILAAFTLIQQSLNQILAEANSAGSVSNSAPARIMVLKAISGPIANAVFPIEQRLTIGRDPAMCNVVFPSNTAGISRRHCVLESHADGIYVMDLGSQYGTFFQNGQRLPINQWMKITGNFYLGSPSAMFAVNQMALGNSNPNPLPNPNPPSPLLVNGVSILGISGPLQGSNFSNSQRLIIGRDPAQCNVVFPAQTPGVSRRHCILERHADGIYIMDLGSTSGTFLQNGQRLPVNQWVKVIGNFYLGSTNVSFAVQ